MRVPPTVEWSVRERQAPTRPVDAVVALVVYLKDGVQGMPPDPRGAVNLDVDPVRADLTKQRDFMI